MSLFLKFVYTALIICICLISYPLLLSSHPLPKEIIRAVRDLDDGNDRQTKFTMILSESKKDKRIREVTYWGMDIQSPEKSDPEEMRLIRIESPSNISGMAFLIYSYPEQLNKEDDQWIYLPALRQERRISSSEKKGAFMGSDFSVADLERIQVNDFTYNYLKDEKIGGKECFVIEGIARDQGIIDKNRILQKSYVYLERTSSNYPKRILR